MKIIKNHIIPVIFDLVQDKKSQKISDLACDVLIDVTKDMKEEDRGESVLSTVLSKFKLNFIGKIKLWQTMMKMRSQEF